MLVGYCLCVFCLILDFKCGVGNCLFVLLDLECVVGASMVQVMAETGHNQSKDLQVCHQSPQLASLQ